MRLRPRSTGPLLVAIALVLLDRAIMAYRWFVLLRPLEGKSLPPFGTILRIFFVSTFVGTFLPASVGGDVVRAYSLSNHGVPKADSMASVFVDRMLGVLSVLLMALVGITLARDLAADRVGAAGARRHFGGLRGGGRADFQRHRRSRSLNGSSRRLPWDRRRHIPASLFTSIRRYATHHGALGQRAGGLDRRSGSAGHSGVLPGRRHRHAASRSSTYFAFIPLILLIMFLPITANGIGTVAGGVRLAVQPGWHPPRRGFRPVGPLCGARHRRKHSRSDLLPAGIAPGATVTPGMQ